MPLLTETEILAEISIGKLIQNGDPNRVSTCSYDMAVGIIFRKGQVIDSSSPPKDQQIVVNPGEVVTMLTAEILNLPNDIAATAYAMNSKSSEGFLVLNPGHVDPGYIGALEIKAINLRKVPLALGIGNKIFTVVFQRVGNMTQGYGHNISPEDKLVSVQKKDVELSVGSISELVDLTGPFTTEEKVKKLILSHWMTWIIFMLTFIAAAASVIGVFLVLMGGPNKQDKSDINAQLPTATTVTINLCDKSKSVKSITEHPCINANPNK